MATTLQENDSQPTGKGIRGIHIFWIVLITILLTAAITFWFVRSYIYAKDFEPVELNAKETQTLNAKLRALGYDVEPELNRDSGQMNKESDEQWLRPEAYSESEAVRDVGFSERELNALLAKNTNLAKKLAIDLSDDLISSRLLVPVDPDFPILGGKTLRVSAGIEMAYRNAKPVVILKGVSIMGIPIPNAWLGDLKNIDLIREFGDETGFWSTFAKGVEDIHIEEGQLKVKLKE